MTVLAGSSAWAGLLMDVRSVPAHRCACCVTALSALTAPLWPALHIRYYIRWAATSQRGSAAQRRGAKGVPAACRERWCRHA